MKLIVISDPAFFVDEAQLINQMFDLGLTSFHLRKPEASAQDVKQLISELDERHYDKVALHQHHEIAALYGMKGLHYKELNRKEAQAEARKLHEQGYTISTSLHKLEDLKQTKEFDYVFFSPVFNSISKPGYKSSLGQGFCLNEKHKCTEVIALGGINKNNIARAQEMNFDGVAVLGCIWRDREKAIEEFKQMQDLCQSVPMS